MAYSRLDDEDNSGSIAGELMRRAAQSGAREVIACAPGDWRLREALEALPLDLTMREDNRFLCTPAMFERWAKGRKSLQMEWFYREMRRHTGLLMEGDQPAGGQWNYDAQNRKLAKAGLDFPEPPRFARDAVVEEALALVRQRFADHFGEAEELVFPTDREQALEMLDHFIRHALPHFGDYQDAMIEGAPFMFHSLLSPALNLGLLSPIELCRAAERAWREGRVPINAAEGFIRQIIGWREYVRGIWTLKGPDYLRQNALGHRRALPASYLGGAHADELRCASGRSDAAVCLCPPYPALDGNRQFRPAGRHRSARGA